MDSTNSFALAVRDIAAGKRRNAGWEAIGVASGDPQALGRARAGLAVAELGRGALSDLSIAPSVVEARIEALSVFDRRFPGELLTELSAADGDHRENPFLSRARDVAKAAVRPLPTVNHAFPSWSWDDHVGATAWDARPLASRPMDFRQFDAKDIQRAAASGGGIFVALRTQATQFDPGCFEPLGTTLRTYDAWAMALVVELSRKSTFDQGAWEEPVLSLLRETDDASVAIPFVYPVLNRQWSLP